MMIRICVEWRSETVDDGGKVKIGDEDRHLREGCSGWTTSANGGKGFAKMIGGCGEWRSDRPR